MAKITLQDIKKKAEVLTDREKQILQQHAFGLGSREMADKLKIKPKLSHRTIEGITNDLIHHFGAYNAKHLICLLVEAGVISVVGKK
jgi:DNA-binding NarL/FixJ family response regulator